jgi:CheY-like chemotaxis protein
MSRRVFLAKPLREAGYEVFEAEDGASGLEAFEEHNPDVVISDLLMPGMDGFEFVEALREREAKCPVIVASADIQQTSRTRVEELGTFGFLNKPFKAEELLEMVDRAVKESGR